MKQLGLSILILLLSNTAFSQSFVGPQASGMGGAGRAAIAPGESAFMNPASIPFFGQYFGTGFYAQSEHPQSGETQQLGVLLSDGYPDRLFQGALGYVQTNMKPGVGDASSQDIYVALSSFVHKNVSFGLQAHRYTYKASGIEETAQYNGGAGLMYAYSKSLLFGVVASDILAVKDTIPAAARLNKTVGVGASYNYEGRLVVRLDAVRPTDQNPDNETDLMTGFESEVMEYMAFRSGFRWNQAIGPDRRVFTAGLGFKGPKLRADYGFEKDTKVAGGVRHSFDLWMSF